MNRTEAAETVSTTIADNLYLYNAADMLDDQRIRDAFEAVNGELTIALTDDVLDNLFADYAAIADAESALSGYLVRHADAPAQEAELDAAVRTFASNLNRFLKLAGYEGEDYPVRTYDDLMSI